MPASSPHRLVLATVLVVAGSFCVVSLAHAQFDPLSAEVAGVAAGDAAWADVDGDGDQDLLLVGNESGSTDNPQPSATLYENEGDGSFSPMSAGLTGVSLGSAAFGDFDGDGDPDLAITGNQSGFSAENLPENSARIYENDGAGNFSPLNAGIEGVTVGSVDWADVDGDGDLDLVVAGNVGGVGSLCPDLPPILTPPICEAPNPSVRIYKNEGNGSFVQTNAGIEEGVALGASQFGDIDQDGAPDLVVAGGQGSLENPVPYAAVYENDGSGTFSPVDASLTDVAGRTATWADVNGDDSLDLILAGIEADSLQRTRLYLNDGGGEFTEVETTLKDVAGGAVAPADIDLDGDTDLALTGRDTTGSPVAMVYENDGTGTFAPVEGALAPVEGSAAAWGHAAGHVAPDLVLAGRDADSVATATLYENQIGGNAQAQLIHNAADPTADTVDVYLGKEKVVDNFGFRSATPFLPVPAGSEIPAGIAPKDATGAEDIVATQPAVFAANETHTVVASGVLNPSGFADNPDGEPIGLSVLVEDGARTTAPPGQVDLRTVHGATDVPTVDIGKNGTTLVQELTYGDITTEYTSVASEQKRLVLTASEADSTVAAFQADLSGLGGTAATVLASGFLDPAANQGGPPLRLIAARPSGDVLTFAPNQPPGVAAPLPNDTLRIPGPPLQVAGVAQTVFNDPEGDPLTVSATSSAPSVVAASGDSTQLTLEPGAPGTAAITVTASDGAQDVSTTFEVTVQERDGEAPIAQALALVDASGNGQTFDFGATGQKIVPQGVVETGRIEVQRFESPPDSVEGIPEGNVSQYRTVIATMGGITPGAGTEVRFPVDDFPGIEAPGQVAAYSRPTPGKGAFNALPTSVDENGTPSDTTDDEIVATTASFSEFVLASDTQPLPVEWAGIDAVQTESGAVVRWQTAAEAGNAGFRVQHRGPESGPESGPGGGPWTRLGFVESKAPGGTSTEGRRYRFAVQRALAPGVHQFRLEQVDLDGGTHRSDPVVLEVSMQEALTVSAPSPNPARGQASLRVAVREEAEVTAVLYNMLGQRVRTVYRGTPQAGEAERLVVETGDLSSGVYVLQVRAGGERRTRRLTVVR